MCVPHAATRFLLLLIVPVFYVLIDVKDICTETNSFSVQMLKSPRFGFEGQYFSSGERDSGAMAVVRKPPVTASALEI